MTVGTTPPNGKQVFEVLCRHDSYTFGDDQRCHPHPSFTPDGRQVIFTLLQIEPARAMSISQIGIETMKFGFIPTEGGLSKEVGIRGPT